MKFPLLEQGEPREKWTKDPVFQQGKNLKMKGRLKLFHSPRHDREVPQRVSRGRPGHQGDPRVRRAHRQGAGGRGRPRPGAVLRPLVQPRHHSEVPPRGGALRPLGPPAAAPRLLGERQRGRLLPAAVVQRDRVPRGGRHLGGRPLQQAGRRHNTLPQDLALASTINQVYLIWFWRQERYFLPC